MSTLDVERDVMVEMRDGVRLATDVFHAPAGPNLAPVLLFRTPYSKDEAEATFGFPSWFRERGYTVVQQDCRGCYRSEGRVGFLHPEALDGLDTLGWIAAQPWGDADVGSWGTSWCSWTQTAMAVAGRSRLKTIVPMMSGADAWTSSVRQGGALELRWIAWAFWHSAQNTQVGLGKTAALDAALIHPERRFSDLLKRWPIVRGETQLALVTAYEAWAFDLLETEDRSNYWNGLSLAPARHVTGLDGVSALYISSWYDSYARGETEMYRAHRDLGGQHVRLVMGPWLHGTATVEQSSAGGVDLGAEAAIPDYKSFLLDWFDAELKVKDGAAQADAPVRVFVMGGGSGALDAAGLLDHGGRWRDEREWPLARADERTLYLHSEGRLNAAAAAAGAVPLTFAYDPADPVPTIGGCISSLLDLPSDQATVEAFHARPRAEQSVPLASGGGFDQRPTAATFQVKSRQGPLAERADVLVFQTEPLAEPLEVTGSVRARLWVATDAADTDFTAKIVDVYPPSEGLPQGFALNLTDSILRLRYRQLDGRSRDVTPGEIYEIDIELYPTSNLFARGHRIRLDISSSNFPRFDRNPNNGHSPSAPGPLVVAHNTVFCDAARPSQITIPVIPSDARS